MQGDHLAALTALALGRLVTLGDEYWITSFSYRVLAMIAAGLITEVTTAATRFLVGLEVEQYVWPLCGAGSALDKRIGASSCCWCSSDVALSSVPQPFCPPARPFYCDGDSKYVLYSFHWIIISATHLVSTRLFISVLKTIGARPDLTLSPRLCSIA